MNKQQGARFRAIVVEDSDLAREGLVEMLADFPQIEIVGDAEHPDSAAELIDNEHPDLIFLDIHMPGETGFDLLARIDYDPLVIFTTAYSEYAIRSFEFQTVDYLLKPIAQSRLAQAIEKLEIYRTEPTGEQENRKLQPEHRLLVKDKDECHLVALANIRYFESCKNYVRLFFEDKSAFIKKSMNQIEERLPEAVFFRCNRQFIINLNAIETIEEWLNEGFIVTLNDGKKIEVSRRNASKLKSMLSF